MSDEDSRKSNIQTQIQGRWDNQEHKRFITALMTYGKNWKMIQNIVQTRNTSQVRSHAQKFFQKLLKIKKQRKKNLKKRIIQSSKIEEQMKQFLSQQSITSNTPIQIIQFLKKDSQPNIQAQSIQKNADFQKEAIKSRTHLVLQEVICCNQQESFLVSLMYSINKHSKNNFNFFQRDEAIAKLIDFPDLNQKQDQQTENKHKKSFILYDDEDDEVKYQFMIKKMNGC